MESTGSQVFIKEEMEEETKDVFSHILSPVPVKRGGHTGKVNLITVSLIPHTQITASVKTLQQNTFMLINYCR